MDTLNIPISKALELIESTRDTGTVFGVCFEKRSTGELRTMAARFGVTKGVTGVGMSYDPKTKNLLCVYDMNVLGTDPETEERLKGAFRMINITGIRTLTLRGTSYVVTHLP